MRYCIITIIFKLLLQFFYSSIRPAYLGYFSLKNSKFFKEKYNGHNRFSTELYYEIKKPTPWFINKTLKIMIKNIPSYLIFISKTYRLLVNFVFILCRIFPILSKFLLYLYDYVFYYKFDLIWFLLFMLLTTILILSLIYCYILYCSGIVVRVSNILGTSYFDGSAEYHSSNSTLGSFSKDNLYMFNLLFQRELNSMTTIGEIIKSHCLRTYFWGVPIFLKPSPESIVDLDLTLEGNGVHVPELLHYPLDERDMNLSFHFTGRGLFTDYVASVKKDLQFKHIIKLQESGVLSKDTSVEVLYQELLNTDKLLKFPDTTLGCLQDKDSELSTILRAELKKSNLDALQRCYTMWVNPEASRPDSFLFLGYTSPAISDRVLHYSLSSWDTFILNQLKKDPAVTGQSVNNFIYERAQFEIRSKSDTTKKFNSFFEFNNMAYNSSLSYSNKAFLLRDFKGSFKSIADFKLFNHPRFPFYSNYWEFKLSVPGSCVEEQEYFNLAKDTFIEESQILKAQEAYVKETIIRLECKYSFFGPNYTINKDDVYFILSSI